MNKFVLTFAFTLLLTTCFIAQGNNNGNTEPEISCPTDTMLCIMEMTPLPNVTTTSDLPNLEYGIVDYSIPSASGTGPSIVGIDEDGVFDPADYGIEPGSSFGVVPVAYDLSQIQETLDNVLKGTVVIFSCCTLIQAATEINVCDSLNAVGISCGSDITGLEDAQNLFNTLGGDSEEQDSISVADLVAVIDSVNTQLAGDQVPPQCGGGDRFDFAYGVGCNYLLLEADTTIVLSDHITSEILTNTVIESNVSVHAPSNVEYQADICVVLKPDFETLLGSTFLAEISGNCD